MIVYNGKKSKLEFTCTEEQEKDYTIYSAKDFSFCATFFLFFVIFFLIFFSGLWDLGRRKSFLAKVISVWMEFLVFF